MKIAALALVLTLAGTLGYASRTGDADAGKVIYRSKCQSCHGPDGKGKQALAKMLGVKMNPLGSPGVQSQTDEDLQKIVTHGNGKMPPVRTLSKREAEDVIAFVRRLGTKKTQ